MSTYQDVVIANHAAAAWALTEAAGLAFAPYIGGSNLVGTGGFLYRQAGPFAAAFGLHENVGAKLTLTFVSVVQPPVTWDCWFKLPSATPAALEVLFYAGNSAANGSGVYVATNGHIHVLHGTIVDVDTGLLWPDNQWHLLQRIASADGRTVGLALDGVIRYRAFLAAPVAPAPNVLVFGGDSGAGSAVAIDVAMPAFYPFELGAGQAAATFQAATDPNGALGNTLTGAGSLLQQILASVRKQF
jgi:hypothetical protein